MNKIALSLACIVVLSLTTNAQESPVPRFEIGGHFTSLTIKSPDPFDSGREPTFSEQGVGGRFTFNLTDVVALEAAIHLFPRSRFDTDSTSSQSQQGLFGAKVGKRTARFGLFGKARVGFTRTHRTSLFTTATPTSSRTDLAADIGGVVELYPSRRIVTRFDIGDTMIRYQGFTRDARCSLADAGTPACPSGFREVKIPDDTRHNLQISAGIGFRFGGVPRASDPPNIRQSTDKLRRYEVGVLFASASIKEFNRFTPQNSTTRSEPGIGGRLTYNLNKSLAAEAEITFFPGDDKSTMLSFNDYTAGRLTQGLFGIKAGKRFERFGIFGKVRPGFAHFDRALRGARRFTTESGGMAAEFDYSGRTALAVDVGGVVEFYPSRRLATRFDVGDTIIHYNDLSFVFPPPLPTNPTPLPGSFTVNVPARTQNNFQFTAGISVRF